MGRIEKRISFDSNVWRYIVDAGALPDVQRAARRSRHTVVVAPAVLYEAAHCGNGALRDRLLSAMALPVWKRLMPEAYSMAEELRSEVKRVRPEWLRPHPDTTVFNKVRHDWTRSRGGVWERIKGEANLLRRHDAPMLQRAREQAHALRDDALEWSPKWRTATLTKTLGGFSAPRPGWNGEPVEPWRVDGLNVFIESMDTPGHPLIDWLGGELDLDLMLFQSAALTKFWLHEVETIYMRRHWLYWAFEFLQRQYKVSDGTPGDAQLGTYLLDVDMMLSADKVFVRIAEKCREDAPFAIAEPMLCGHGDAVLQVLGVLEAR
jgi:hypothetical protein